MKAIYGGQVIAESDDTVVVEGNHYFPAESVDFKFLKPSKLETICPWKGSAKYFSVVISPHENKDAAWFYPEPKDAAAGIKGHIAFWRGVEVVS